MATPKGVSLDLDNGAVRGPSMAKPFHVEVGRRGVEGGEF